MYLYDIVPNQLRKLKTKEIAEILNKSEQSIRRAARNQMIYKGLMVAVLKKKPSALEKKLIQEKLNIVDEYWVDLEGSDGVYQISSYGRIKKRYKQFERFILPATTKNGDLIVFLQIKNTKRVYKVSRLVATHFIRKPNSNEFIWHKNGIKIDCFAGNLQWLDKRKVISKSITNLKSKGVVILHPETNELLGEFRSARNAAKQLHYDFSTICKRCNGNMRNDIGYIFMWKDEYEKQFGEII